MARSVQRHSAACLPAVAEGVLLLFVRKPRADSRAGRSQGEVGVEAVVPIGRYVGLRLTLFEWSIVYHVLSIAHMIGLFKGVRKIRVKAGGFCSWGAVLGVYLRPLARILGVDLG